MLLTENELRDYIKIIIESNETGMHKAISDEELKQIKPDGKFTRLLRKIGLATTGLVTVAMLNSAINLDNSINNNNVSIEKVANFQNTTKSLNNTILADEIDNIEEELLPSPEFEDEVSFDYGSLDIQKLKNEMKKWESEPLYNFMIKGGGEAPSSKKKYLSLYPYKDGDGYSVGFGTKFLDKTTTIPKNWVKILYKKLNVPKEIRTSQKNMINLETANYCFNYKFNIYFDMAKNRFENFDNFPPILQEVLVDMYYNIGDSYTKKFPDFFEHMDKFSQSLKEKNIDGMIEGAEGFSRELNEKNSPDYWSQQSNKGEREDHRAKSNYKKALNVYKNISNSKDTNESKKLRSNKTLTEIYKNLYT